MTSTLFYVTGMLRVQLWNIMRDIQARQEELERKWDEEVDAPKRAARKAKNPGKGTSQKKAAVRKPRGPLASIRPITDSSRQHPVTDPRMSTPAILRSNAPSLQLFTPNATFEPPQHPQTRVCWNR